MSLRYVVVAPSYHENNGGAIALHYLCHMLNECGADAALSPRPRTRPLVGQHSVFRHLRQSTKNLVRSLVPARMSTHPSLLTPINERPIDSDTIVIYPEVVDGNPLQAQHVVRWFLHKPGYHTGRTAFGPDDMRFFYQRAFWDGRELVPEDRILTIRWYRTDIYRQWNFGNRSGTCYLIRKGRDTADLEGIDPSTILDGSTHAEMAAAFNRYERFVSYDPYTLYSKYAALCGCISIVVPIEGVDASQWRPEPELRYGIAYGFDDVERAIQTRPELEREIAEDIEEQHARVDRFIRTTQERFAKNHV